MNNRLRAYVERLLRQSAEHEAVPSSEPSIEVPEPSDSVAVKINDDTRREKEKSSLEGALATVAEGEEIDPLIETGECRICQDEDSIDNLEAPCGCNGSLKYAHRKCVQQWCNEKGDITCEICHQQYGPDYIAPPRPPQQETVIDIGGWALAPTPLSLRDSRLLGFADAEGHMFEDEYDEHAASDANGVSFCRSVAVILILLLLMRHALNDPDADEDDNGSTFLSLFLIRAAGFLLPCYIMAWAIGIMQQQRQRQEEAAALATTQIAFVVGQHRGLHVALAPGPSVPPQSQEAV